MIQIYGIVKPTLDELSTKREEEERKNAAAGTEIKPVDLSEIPF